MYVYGVGRPSLKSWIGTYGRFPPPRDIPRKYSLLAKNVPFPSRFLAFHFFVSSWLLLPCKVIFQWLRWVRFRLGTDFEASCGEFVKQTEIDFSLESCRIILRCPPDTTCLRLNQLSTIKYEIFVIQHLYVWFSLFSVTRSIQAFLTTVSFHFDREFSIAPTVKFHSHLSLV